MQIVQLQKELESAKREGQEKVDQLTKEKAAKNDEFNKKIEDLKEKYQK